MQLLQVFFQVLWYCSHRFQCKYYHLESIIAIYTLHVRDKAYVKFFLFISCSLVSIERYSNFHSLTQFLVCIPEDDIRLVFSTFPMIWTGSSHQISIFSFFVTGGGFIVSSSLFSISWYNICAVWLCLALRYKVGAKTGHEHTKWYSDSPLW